MRIVLTNPGLNPGATIVGEPGVGRSHFVGAEAAMIQQVSLRENTMISAGALVIGDIAAKIIAAGVPARIVMHYGR